MDIKNNFCSSIIKAKLLRLPEKDGSCFMCMLHSKLQDEAYENG